MKIYLEYLCQWPGSGKENNQTNALQMKAVEEKQGRCIKMLFGQCFYVRIALCLYSLVFVKKELFNTVDHSKDNYKSTT